MLVDGRGKKVKNYEEGFFVFPTVLDGVPPQGEIARTEIFGPVLSLMHAASLDEAIEMVNARSYGNMACIFTRDGAHSATFSLRGQRRQHRHQRRRGRASGNLPLQRLGREFLRRLARPSTPRHRVLYPDEGRDRALAAGMEPEILIDSLGH